MKKQNPSQVPSRMPRAPRASRATREFAAKEGVLKKRLQKSQKDFLVRGQRPIFR